MNLAKPYLLLDIETCLDREATKLIDEIEPFSKPITPPDISEIVGEEEFIKEKKAIDIKKIQARYTKQATIDKHIEDDVDSKDYKAEYNSYLKDIESKYKEVSTNPVYAMAEIIRFREVDENGEISETLFTNPDRCRKVEKEIIEKACDFIYKKATSSNGKMLSSKLIVTYNGKRFDIPVLIERGGISGAKIMFTWLETLTARHCDMHYDMFETRSYKGSPLNRLSLSRNLLLRFGPKFVKKKINHVTATHEEKLVYSSDEMDKFHYWYLIHSGSDDQKTIDALYNRIDMNVEVVKEEESEEIPGLG